MMWHAAHLFWNTLQADLIADGFCPVMVGEVVIAASPATIGRASCGESV